MAIVLDELVAVLGYDIRGERNLRRFNQGLDRTHKTAQRVAKTIGILGAGLVAALTPPALFRSIDRVANELDRLQKAADRVGLGVEDLQRGRFAAGQAAGVNDRTFDMAMQRFSRRIGEAAKGTGELNKIVEETGLVLRNADGSMRSQIDILADYADIVGKAGSEQEQLALAFKAFDSEGAALVNLLRRGSTGIRQLMDDADRLGYVMDRRATDAAVAFNDQQDRLAKIWSGLRGRASTELFPLFTRWMKGLEDIYVANRQVIDQRVADAFVGIGEGLEVGREVAARWSTAIGQLADMVAQVTVEIGMQVQDATGLPIAFTATALAGLILAKLTRAFGIVKGLLKVAVPLLVLDDIISFNQGDDSLIGANEARRDMVSRIVKNFEGIGAAATRLNEQLKDLINSGDNIDINVDASAVEAKMFEVEDLGKRILLGIVDAITDPVQTVLNTLNAGLEGIRLTIEAFSAGLTRVFSPEQMSRFDKVFDEGTKQANEHPLLNKMLIQRAKQFRQGLEKVSPDQALQGAAQTINQTNTTNIDVDARVSVPVTVNQKVEAARRAGQAAQKATEDATTKALNTIATPPALP